MIDSITPRTLESFMVLKGKSGDIFYSNKSDRALTAIASAYKRKIKTERFIIVTTGKGELKASKLTKVTLL